MTGRVRSTGFLEVPSHSRLFRKAFLGAREGAALRAVEPSLRSGASEQAEKSCVSMVRARRSDSCGVTRVFRRRLATPRIREKSRGCLADRRPTGTPNNKPGFHDAFFCVGGSSCRRGGIRLRRTPRVVRKSSSSPVDPGRYRGRMRPSVRRARWTPVSKPKC